MSKSRSIEPCRCVFVVGTPGAGKSLFCNELDTVLGGNDLECTKHGDYPFLQSLYRTDQGVGRRDRFKKGLEGAEFEVIDPAVYDLALKAIYDNVLSRPGSPGTIKIVEFARPRYDTAFLYYTLEALSESVIIHITTPIEVCLQRNERRRQKLEERRRLLERRLTGEINPEDVFDEDRDLHYVPLKVMHEFYARDPKEDQRNTRDQKLILSLLPARGYICLENSIDDRDTFRDKARKVIEKELLPRIACGESYSAYYDRRLKEIRDALPLFIQDESSGRR